MNLALIPVVAETLALPAMKRALEQMHDAARRIHKRVDLGRERDRFSTACDAIQKLALQLSVRGPVIVSGVRVNEIISALPRLGDAIFPIVTAEDLTPLLRIIDDTAAQCLSDAPTVVVFTEWGTRPRQRETDEHRADTSRAFSRSPRRTRDANRSRGDSHRGLNARLRFALSGDAPFPWIDASHAEVIDIFRRYLFVDEIPLQTIQVPVNKTVEDEEAWARIRRSLSYRIRRRALPFLRPVAKPTRTIEVLEDRTVPAPIEPEWVNVAFEDGSRSAPFPLRALAPAERTSDMPVIHAALMSARHFEMDAEVDVTILRNAEISRRGDVSFAEQEELAFGIASRFLGQCLNRADGLEIHLFHTGLEPAVLGAYRAVVESLRTASVRGRLVVVPRILRHGRYESLEAWH